MDYAKILIPFAGGLGMFIYGMQIMAQGLERAAGFRMKKLLEVLTGNKFFGVLLGAFITAVIQSSSATTVMVVGFVNAGIMNLSQAMGVIMGANIGTTTTGWLVSSVEWAKLLSPATLAPIAIIVGVIIMMTARKHSTKEISAIIIGFGILFVGISTMSSSVAPLKESEAFRSMLVTLGSNPLLGILAGAFVTAIIQSSSASVGILQSLAAAGLVPFNAAVYIIMGQNIGTCVTAMLSGIGAKRNAKTAALMHLLFNIIGSVLFSIAAILFFQTVSPELGRGMITQTQISMAHTIFNIGTTILLFPVSGLIIKLAKKIGRVEEQERGEDVLLLDERMLETPGIAVQSACGEVFRMGHIIVEALNSAANAIFTLDTKEIAFIKERENTVDTLSAGLTEYVVKINGLPISEKEMETMTSMLQVITDMERVCDYCENMAEFAEQLKQAKASFSDMARKELREMFDAALKSFVYSVEALENNDHAAAMKVIEEETRADDLEIKLRARHIRRLAGNQCSTQAGIVFIDALSNLERISDHARNIAEEVLAGV